MVEPRKTLRKRRDILLRRNIVIGIRAKLFMPVVFCLFYLGYSDAFESCIENFISAQSYLAIIRGILFISSGREWSSVQYLQAYGVLYIV